MGYLLFREVLDHAPADVTPAELVVWLVIADDANDVTRTGWIVKNKLTRRARLKQRAVRSALELLAERGYELRMIRGRNKHGRPVYAHRGAQTTYVLPVLDPERKAAPERHLSETGNADTPGEERRHQNVKRWHENAGKAAPERQKAAPERHPSPHPLRVPSSSSASGPAAREGAAGGPDEDDGRAADAAAGPGGDQVGMSDYPPGDVFDAAAAEVKRRLPGIPDGMEFEVVHEIVQRYKPRDVLKYIGGMSTGDLNELLADAIESERKARNSCHMCGAAVPPELIGPGLCRQCSRDRLTAKECRHCGNPWRKGADVPDDLICTKCRQQTSGDTPRSKGEGS